MVQATNATGRGFRWLILATSIATYALVVLGGVVRATGSGDACPDWPRCHGELLPPLESGVLIEFSHRLLASLVGFLVLATAVVAWRMQRHRPTILWGSTAAVVLVGGQIVLGGLTVLNELPSSMVMAHLVLATALLTTLLLVAFDSFGVRPTEGLAPSSRNGAAAFRNLAIFAALTTFGLMLTGSYVTGSGAGIAIRDWPLFDGRLIPEGHRLVVIHATHRLTAAVIGLILVYVAVQAWRTHRAERAIVLGSAFALVLYVAQALVGAANVWTVLSPAASAAHLALAAALWATLVMVALFAHRAAQPLLGRDAASVRERPVSPRPGVMPERSTGTLPAREAS